MIDNDEAITALEEALKQSEDGLNMITTAEINRTDAQFTFGILVRARESVALAKANIERAIALLKS